MCSECQLCPYQIFLPDGHLIVTGRDLEKTCTQEMKEQGWTWGFTESIAADRQQWQPDANLHEED